MKGEGSKGDERVRGRGVKLMKREGVKGDEGEKG